MTKQTSQATISTIGIDIGKNSFHVVGFDERAWSQACRPKQCKLALSPWLRRVVSKQLRLNWSPEQIAGWLKRTYPGDEVYHVSHETIYRSLTTRSVGRDRLVTMKPTRGYNSPGCHSTLATTRLFLSQLPA